MRRFGPLALPGLEILNGVPPSLRTIVVVPVLLTSAEQIEQQIERLEVHALASPDPLPAALAGFGDADDNGGTGASLEEFAAHGFSVTEADGTAVDGGGSDEEDEL